MIAGALSLLLALASGGAPPGADGRGSDAPAMTLVASLSDDGERLEVVLSPGSAPVAIAKQESLWTLVAIRPRVIVELQHEGRRVSPCFYPSPTGDRSPPTHIQPGSEHRTSVAIDDLRRNFCLGEGHYRARFVYEIDRRRSHPSNVVTFDLPAGE
jgi:hypothetical protein